MFQRAVDQFLGWFDWMGALWKTDASEDLASTKEATVFERAETVR